MTFCKVILCDCHGRAPTYPTCRDFEHFPECPLSGKQKVGEFSVGGAEFVVFGAPDYWDQRAEQSFARSNEWEARFLAENARRVLLEKTFQHIHKQGGNDICAKCGLDLRDPIHVRIKGESECL